MYYAILSFGVTATYISQLLELRNNNNPSWSEGDHKLSDWFMSGLTMGLVVTCVTSLALVIIMTLRRRLRRESFRKNAI